MNKVFNIVGNWYSARFDFIMVLFLLFCSIDLALALIYGKMLYVSGVVSNYLIPLAVSAAVDLFMAGVRGLAKKLKGETKEEK